jgi:hypothetical protein
MNWLGKKAPVIALASLYTLAAPLLLFSGTASADKILTRSVEIGSSQPSATTFQEFTFTIPTADNIGSIEYEYCSNDPFIDEPCTAPVGLDISGASIASQTGVTGFSVHGTTTANKLVLTRAAAPNLAFQVATYRFNNMVNPDSDESVYVRITTYASDDASGTPIDSGAVVFATTSGVSVEGFVPPFLTFCTGLTVAMDCTSTQGNFINLGELSKTSANFSSSQYSGATNDPGGFTTSVAGSTMTAGNKIIPALASQAPNRPGTSQFGINLRNNSNPNIGGNKAGSGDSVVMAGYNTPNLFKFVPNQVVSRSTLPTEFNRFTVSYLVNASPSQPAGIYTATLTYIAVAAF